MSIIWSKYASLTAQISTLQVCTDITAVAPSLPPPENVYQHEIDTTNSSNNINNLTTFLLLADAKERLVCNIIYAMHAIVFMYATGLYLERKKNGLKGGVGEWRARERGDGRKGST